MDRSKWNFLSSRIETTQQALSAIKVTSNVFFAVAVLAVMTVVFLVSSDYFKVAGEGTRQAAGLVLRSAAGIAIAAFLLRRFNSRVVAILFLTNAIIVGGTLLVVGGSIFIAFTIVFLWAAGRAVYATFRLQTILKEPVKIGNSA